MSALAGIDIALWDLKGCLLLELPLHFVQLTVSRSEKTRSSDLSTPRWQIARQAQSLCLDWRG